LEQLQHARSGGDYLLEVVEDEEEVLVAQSRAEAMEEGLPRRLGYAQRLSDGGEDQIGIADGGQRNEIGAICEAPEYTGSHLQSEPCLTDATWSGKGEEAGLARFEE
jgi:hypothetical protein